MMNGVVVGIVTDNVDPEKMHRVRVEFTVDADEAPKSWWARIVTPMAGGDRGLVMIPEVGTEVIVGFAYRSLTPFVLGAVYNGGDDTPGPYANEDGNNDHRRYWSRNSHWIDFDDTDGDEHVRLTSTTETEGILQDLDSAQKTINETVNKDAIHEAGERITFKCTDFEVEASGSISMEAGSSTVIKAGSSASIDSGGNQTYQAGKVDINGGSPGSPDSPPDTPEHKHPPTS